MQFVFPRPFILLAVFGLSVGCGEKSDRASVDGTVAYDGKPIGGAILSFFPTTGRPVNAPTSPDGKYEVELSSGEYRVTITLGVALPPGYEEGDPLPPPPVKLPPKYTRRVDTPLTASVSAEDSSQTVDFNLD